MVFTNNKSCIFIVKNVKNAHVTHFQKKLVLISKNKIKGTNQNVLFV